MVIENNCFYYTILEWPIAIDTLPHNYKHNETAVGGIYYHCLYSQTGEIVSDRHLARYEVGISFTPSNFSAGAEPLSYARWITITDCSVDLFK